MTSSGRPNRIILADGQIAYRSSTARTLAAAEDMRIIAHCSDRDRLYRAITSYPGSIVLFATSLQPDLTRLQILLETTCSRGIVLAEDNDTAGKYMQMGFSGVVFRNDMGPTLVESVHRVAAGEFWMPAMLMHPDLGEEYWAGSQTRDRLPENEMRLLSKLAVGLCKRLRMGVGEQMRPFGAA